MNGPASSVVKGANAMAKRSANREQTESQNVTADRVARLYRLVAMLAPRPVARATLLRRLRMNQRSFYRDIELLRRREIPVNAADGRYRLGLTLEQALACLPFPDPGLTLGQAMALARGRSAVHKVLQARVRAITG